jgi:hypothetical protein
MTAAAPAATATAPAAKIGIAPIALAAKVIAAAFPFAGSGNNRKQAPDARAVTLLANDTGISVLIARQQLKTCVTIMAVILIERHRYLTYLSSLQFLERPDSLPGGTIHLGKQQGRLVEKNRAHADAITV